MIAGTGSKHTSANHRLPRAQWMRENAARYFAYFRRMPRFAASAVWRQSFRLGVATLIFIAIIAATMIAVDTRAVFRTSTNSDAVGYGKTQAIRSR